MILKAFTGNADLYCEICSVGGPTGVGGNCVDVRVIVK